MAAFNLPLNLPHAATVAHRIRHHMRGRGAAPQALERVVALVALLDPWRDQEENGPAEAAEQARQAAAALARGVVEDIEKSGVGYDRLGQAVRNCFECLAMGEEGARISLRAGEDPNSTLRPR